MAHFIGEQQQTLSPNLPAHAQGVPTLGWQLVGRRLSTASASLGATTSPDHSAKVASSIGTPKTRGVDSGVDNVLVTQSQLAKLHQLQPVLQGAAGEGARIVVVGARLINPTKGIVGGQSQTPSDLTIVRAREHAHCVRRVLLDFQCLASAITLPDEELDMYEGQLSSAVRLATTISVIEDNTPAPTSEIRSDGYTESIMFLADQDEYLEFWVSRTHGGEGIDPADAVGVLISRG